MKIEIVYGNERQWEGLYIDGKLVLEGSRLGVWEVLSAIHGHNGTAPFALRGMYLTNAQDRVLNDLGNLPEDIGALDAWKKATP